MPYLRYCFLGCAVFHFINLLMSFTKWFPIVNIAEVIKTWSDQVFILYSLPNPCILHTYFYSFDSRLGDLGHLGLGDGRLVLIQWVQLKMIGGKWGKKHLLENITTTTCEVNDHVVTAQTGLKRPLPACKLQSTQAFAPEMFVVWEGRMEWASSIKIVTAL